ncbi:MAG: GDP-mannose 4,6-dehydratase [Pseudomonadota bacterium]
MKVFVTGAGGFIGSHLVEALLGAGHEVKALVRYVSDGRVGFLDGVPEELTSGLEVVRGDIRDGEFLYRELADCRRLVHLAALIGIPYSYDAPQQYLDVNVTGTHNVLSAALKREVERSVVFSTSEVYGTALSVPIDELHPRQPQSPYSASKIAADALASSYHASFGLPVTIARPFNTYGPRQSERAFIPTVIKQLLFSSSEEVLLGDLTPTRDLVFVEDTASIVCKLLESDCLVGQDVNICTGREYSIGEVVERLRTMIAPNKRVVRDPARIRPASSEVFRLLGDNTRLKTHLSSIPETSLEHGLMKTIEWFERASHSASNFGSGYVK